MLSSQPTISCLRHGSIKRLQSPYAIGSDKLLVANCLSVERHDHGKITFNLGSKLSFKSCRLQSPLPGAKAILLRWSGARSNNGGLLFDIFSSSKQAQECLDSNEETRIAEEEPSTQSPKPPSLANKDQRKILTPTKGYWFVLDIDLYSLFWSGFGAVMSLLVSLQCVPGLNSLWVEFVDFEGFTFF